MISDILKNAGLYAKIDDRLAVALKYLQTHDLQNLPLGKFEIEGNEVFGNVMEYETKNPEDALWEAHKKYIDIQLILKGSELIGFGNIHNMNVIDEYNMDKDIVFLKGQGDYVTLKPGMFVVLFPNDAHQPGVRDNNNAPVKKLVVKVLV